MDYYNKDIQLTFPQIVMKQITLIQNIESKELRNCKRTIITPIGEQVFDNEDTRYSYLQSVELLGSLLYPYFDKETKKIFDNFIDLYEMELKKAIEDKDFRKELNFYFNLPEDEEELKRELLASKRTEDILTLLLNEKCKSARRLFRQLIGLLKEIDFLGSVSYGDSSGGEGGINESEDVEVVVDE